MATPMYHESVYKSVELVWNDKYTEAVKLLEPRKMYPRESYSLASVVMNKSFISSSKEDRMDSLEKCKDCEKTIKNFTKNDAKLAELIQANNQTVDEISKLNWSLDCKLVYAEVLEMKAILQLTLGSFIKGAYNLRSSWKSFLGVQKEIEANSSKVREELKNNVKYNTGVFYFMVSFSPAVFLKVLELLGFVADKELGIANMKEVYEKDNYVGPKAALFLCFNYLLLPRGLSKPEENLVPAEKMLKELLNKYPGSSFFLWQQSLLHSKRGEVKEAIDAAQKCVDSCKELKIAPNSYLTNLAIMHYMACDWKKASELFEKVTSEDAGDFDMKGLCGLQLATCYHMMGEEEKAKKMLDRVPKIASKHSRFDKIAEKKVSQFKKRGWGFGIFEILFVRRDLHHLQKPDSQKMLSILEEVNAKQQKNKDLEIAYSVIKAVLLRNCGDKAQALELFKKVIAAEKELKEDMWPVVCAHYEIAEMAYFDGSLDETRKHLQAAKSHSGYDFQELIGGRVSSALTYVNKELKAKGVKIEEEKKPEPDSTGLEDELRGSKLEEDDLD